MALVTRKRLIRLAKGFFPALCRPDDAWALARLAPDEAELYRAMDVRDREHNVAVARRLLERWPDAPDCAVRAALIHDAGKSLRPYNVWERIFTALLERWAPEVEPYPLRTGLTGAWQVRRHHPRYAADRIADPCVARLVGEHHSGTSPWAVRLRAIDAEF
ncbi:phosphohydrolase [Oceanithermus sp.]|uniref:phosphohydrolase n=1 Tax=Oceanithermus sp. TaxID=2268145 RepID=UPI00257AFFE3|nr:phosphohydrolase [Oceanithermus sp.]